MSIIKSEQNRFYLHVFVYFLLTFGVGQLPPIGITALGMKIVGVFLGLMYGWTFIGFSWPSLFSMLALGFTGYDTPNNVLAAGFGHSSVIFTIFIFAFTNYCDQCGLTSTMSKWFLSREILLGRPYLFAWIIFLTSLLISIVASQFAAVFLISSVLYTIFKSVGYQKGDAYPAYILAGVVIAGVLSFTCVPWAATNLVGISALEATSGGAATVPYGTMMMIAIPICILALAAYTLIIKYLLRPDVDHMKHISAEFLQEIRSQICFDKGQKIAVAALSIFFAIMLMPTFISKGNMLYPFFSQLNMTAALIPILTILSVIRLNGKPIFDLHVCAREGINWNVVLMLASSMPISAALSCEEAGISILINGLMHGLLNHFGIIAFLVIFMLIANVATQFTHNVTIVLLGVPIIWNLSISTGVNPVGMTILLLMAAGSAFVTPSASTIGALMFANAEWIPMKRAFMAGFLANVASLLLMICLGLPMVFLLVGI